jgi:hypothetical protein
MTFSLRRKLPIILRAALRKQAATITSALILFSILASAQGQNYLTPKFVATPKPLEPFPTVVPAHFQRRQTAETDLLEPAAVQVLQWQKPADDGMDDFIRTELPGPQRLFMRESEAQFYERLAQKAKKTPGATRAIFPPQEPVSKEKYTPRRFENMPPVLVEPAYVCHRRLLFEQPNFERAGYNFGILQPAIGLGMFYYDLALMPYHAFSDLNDLGECNASKCLPGDPAPFLMRRERFSVTGAIAEAGSIFGLLYLFPYPTSFY